MYRLAYTDEAKLHMQKLKRAEPKAFQKLADMLHELMEHPTSGIGHPEQLKGMPEDCWSRRITKKHRLVYRIFKDEVLVLVLRAYGHYTDK